MSKYFYLRGNTGNTDSYGDQKFVPFSTGFAKEDWILRGPRSSSFLVPRNLSHHMIRQAPTGDIVLDKSRGMTGRTQTLPCRLGGRRGQDDRKPNTLAPLGSAILCRLLHVPLRIEWVYSRSTPSPNGRSISLKLLNFPLFKYRNSEKNSLTFDLSPMIGQAVDGKASFF